MNTFLMRKSLGTNRSKLLDIVCRSITCWKLIGAIFDIDCRCWENRQREKKCPTEEC